MELVRKLVSGKKLRLDTEDYNLDLSYITPRVIAMSLPAEGLDQIFRNPGSEVARYLNERHPAHYKCYNLAGISYNYARFDNRVKEFPWPDHHAPPLDLLFQACGDIAEWMQADPENVVAVHCKAGKGRTGTLICCFLLFSGLFTDPEDTFKYYRCKRFSKGGGVTHPSQRRYVTYFQKVLQGHVKSPVVKHLQCILLTTAPRMRKHSSRPFVEILEGNQVKYTSKADTCEEQAKLVDDWESCHVHVIPVTKDVVLNGDILCKLKHWGFVGISKICRFSFNTAFVYNNRLDLRKCDLDPDIFVHDRRCSDHFQITLEFRDECSCTSNMAVDERCANCKRLIGFDLRKWAVISEILSRSPLHTQRSNPSILFGEEQDDINTVLQRIEES